MLLDRLVQLTGTYIKLMPHIRAGFLDPERYVLGVAALDYFPRMQPPTISSTVQTLPWPAQAEGFSVQASFRANPHFKRSALP